MFQFDFGRHVRKGPAAVPPALDRRIVDSVGVTFWEEHCLECAQPECYTSCPLYVYRPDGNCARFTHGIIENSNFEGLCQSGAEIKFRKWGKLQTTFGPGSFKVSHTKTLTLFDGMLSRLATRTALNRGRWRHLRSLNPQRYYQYARRKFIERMMRRAPDGDFLFDELLIETWNLGSEACRMFVEAYDSAIPSFRESIHLPPGQSLTTIPFSALKLRSWQDHPHLRRLVLFPEENAECHVVFTWLDLVRRKTDRTASNATNAIEEAASVIAPSVPTSQEIDREEGKKVKCVVWDLDNTMWRGILVEDGAEGIRLREEAQHLLDQFDRRGILQSIASKNDHERTWELVNQLGIAEYFLYPEINWGPKSASLRRIATELNIGIDSLVLIDDSPFERAEVQQQLPDVRVYDPERELEHLLGRPEFTVPVTEEGGRRREMYRVEQLRKEARSEHPDDYDAFLNDCRIRVRIFHPAANDEIIRCAELLQRTNQLNLSGNRYEVADLRNLVATDGVLSLGIECSDRFGNYGLIGFLSVRSDNGEATITDLALSCRVAQRTVEHAIIGWLLPILRSKGIGQLQAQYVTTDRNKPLREVLEEIGFTSASSLENLSFLQIGTHTAIPRSQIVFVDASAVS